MIYEAFGITFESDFEFEGIPASSSPADLNIARGLVPRLPDDADAKSERYTVHRDRILIEISGIARFFIENGNSVTYCREGGTDYQMSQLLLGRVMCAVLSQRSILALHASAVVKNAKCLVFTGFSGAGKSTLAAALVRHGFHLHTDDLTPLYFDDHNRCVAASGLQVQRLTKQSLDYFGLNHTDFPLTGPTTPKHLIAFQKTVHKERVPVHGIYYLIPTHCSVPVIKTAKGVQRFSILKNLAYGRIFFERSGTAANLFKAATAVAQHAPIKVVQRPNSDISRLDELVQLIISDSGID